MQGYFRPIRFILPPEPNPWFKYSANSSVKRPLPATTGNMSKFCFPYEFAFKLQIPFNVWMKLIKKKKISKGFKVWRVVSKQRVCFHINSWNETKVINFTSPLLRKIHPSPEGPKTQNEIWGRDELSRVMTYTKNEPEANMKNRQTKRRGYDKGLGAFDWILFSPSILLAIILTSKSKIKLSGSIWLLVLFRLFVFIWKNGET